MICGRIHSFQSLGAADGPGVRCVVFMQGCPLRCAYCHNPDTWDFGGGSVVGTDEIFAKILRLKPYFGSFGGVTVSGGEPLCQPDFVRELFSMCKAAGINTALDTSGSVMPKGGLDALLDATDLVLLDYKMTTEELMKRYIGTTKKAIDEFISALAEKNVPVWIRQVIVEGINDNKENIHCLVKLQQKYDIIKKTELLPMKKLCEMKYEIMGIKFPLSDYPETATATIERLSQMLL